jgi:putative PIN family toxin of toxin-antitoxin system
VRVVLDTNVLVSAVLSPAGPPARILDLVFAGMLVPLFDDRILYEYRDVLSRRRLRIPPAEASMVMEYLIEVGRLVSVPPLALDLADPDDAPFVEVAAGAGAEALVTGNLRHFTRLPDELRVRALSPADFLALWRERTG